MPQPVLSSALRTLGQFVYERTLAFGLVETVVCDGKTILHLYPEIGLGSRRPMSRFHRAEGRRRAMPCL